MGCVCNFEDSAEKVRDKVKELKQRVDEEIKKEHPWDVRYDVCPHGVPYDGPQCDDCSW